MKPLLETLTSGADYLAKRGVEDARLNMEHLLAHVLQCRRLDLYLRFNESLDEQQLAPLRGLLKRRGEGEPLQHLLGTVEFHGNDFVSDHRALIPRPETEYLVSLLTDKRFKQSPPAQVLDVGTGTGCIGLSLAKAWSGSTVTMIDVSEDALELARLNASRLGLAGERVRFVRSDLFEKIAGGYDLIVANLPYIPTAEIQSLSREVKRDPHTALDGGPDGLRIVQRMLDESATHLNDHGALALELHHDQAVTVCGILTSLGYRNVESAPDLAGIERFVFAVRPEQLPAEPTLTE